MPVEEVFSARIEKITIVDENGVADAKLEPKLAPELLEKMYETMLLYRMFDDKCVKLQRQGRMYTYIPAPGQEASQVGTGLALKEEDWAFPSYREQGVQITRGVPLRAILLYWMGNEEGVRQITGNTAAPTIAIASQCLHAVGAAWASKIRKESAASIVYFGDGATSEGDFHEAMNYAGVLKIPTVFICQNNQWAISVPRGIQTASRTIAQKALAYGAHGVQVDGNDVLAVYMATMDALERARRGEGPTLIECVTYRMSMHSTADDPSKYRDEAEVEPWKKRDPIMRFEKYLQTKGLWSEEYRKQLEDDITKRIAAAVEEAEKYAPEPTDILKYAFKDLTPQLQEELVELKQLIEEGAFQ